MEGLSTPGPASLLGQWATEQVLRSRGTAWGPAKAKGGEVQTGMGIPCAPHPRRRTNPANTAHCKQTLLLLRAPHPCPPQPPSSPASPASSRCPGHLPASGSVLCRKGPRAPPWSHVAMGMEAPPRSRCAPPLRPHPDTGNKVQRRQKNDTQADEGGRGARCRPWPYGTGTEPLPGFPPF